MLEQERIIPPEELRGRHAVELYRAWHALEQQRPESERIDVVDFDLVPEDFDTVSIKTRQEAVKRLADLSAQVTPSTPFLEFLKLKAQSTLTFVSAVEGQRLPLNEYVEKTLGITPEIFPETEIRNQKEKTDQTLSQLEGFSTTGDDYGRYFTENQLDEAEIIRDFNKAKTGLFPIIASSLELSELLPLIRYAEQIVTLDEPWIAYVSGTRSGIFLRINSHPRNRIRWVKGIPEVLAIHEVGGHLLQSLQWKSNVEKGLINPAYGITTIPGPEQWQSEGMANTLPLLIPEVYANMSKEAQFTFQVARLSDMVMNNVHIMVNSGRSIDEIKAYLRKYLPHETDERIERTVRDRTVNPLFRSYLFTYSDGGRYFANASESLGEKSILLLRELYQRPMSPSQIKQLVASLQK